MDPTPSRSLEKQQFILEIKNYTSWDYRNSENERIYIIYETSTWTAHEQNNNYQSLYGTYNI